MPRALAAAEYAAGIPAKSDTSDIGPFSWDPHPEQTHAGNVLVY